ncbi:hypothetical protein E5K00_16890 [Hymenobacter aquaticus]|uniref:DUF3887 domain-containing protein n=1 Tax=Hymenobacter aquaticus TaxID=1867101 RepID=A0A4Z0PXC7_9BACT|nr:hypothetical protein [Hymenobacter aquaticus]TGE21934.1 hypothetical protein E5K00_16890 [Hymenobacter aquaticus]
MTKFHLPVSWRRTGLLLAVLLLLAVPGSARPSQVQVARQFLLAVLRGDYTAAYQLLAPEAQATLKADGFRAAARPLYEQGQRRGTPFDLYKLGYRIDEANTVRNFYSFMFKSDTLAARPVVQLDVTFRDSTATRILTFGLIPAPQTPRK